MQDKFYGCRPGIVIQNNDPEERGRIKVFVPDISATVYDDWNNKIDAKSFSNIGKNDNDSISVIIDKLKDVLPWAECAAPIIGETGHSYYNAQDNSNEFGDGVNRSGDKPSKALEDNPPVDSFGESYRPSSFSGAAKGVFSTPRVGSHVWVFFDNGDIQNPVYFATLHSTEEWKSINGSDNNSYENISKRDGSSDGVYKNKLTISQKGGVLEINNTDNEESVKISQYGGSFKQWDNDKTKEYVKNDDHKLVENNSNETVKNLKNLNVGGVYNENVKSNKNLTVEGTHNEDVSGNKNLTVTGVHNIDAPVTNVKGEIIQTGGSFTTTGAVTAIGMVSSLGADVMALGVISLIETFEATQFHKFELVELDNDDEEEGGP